MAHSPTCKVGNTLGLHICYTTAKVSGMKWPTWLYGSCAPFVREMIQYIEDDNEFSDLQRQETLDQLYIIIDLSSSLLFLSDRTSWDMHKHVQSQTFKTIRTCLENVIVNVRGLAEKNKCCLIYHYYRALYRLWYVMTHLGEFSGTSLASLTRRYICQELWTRAEIECLPKTEVPEMLQKELLDYWKHVECPPAPLSCQPEPCDCNCCDDAVKLTCYCNMCLSQCSCVISRISNPVTHFSGKNGNFPNCCPHTV